MWPLRKPRPSDPWFSYTNGDGGDDWTRIPTTTSVSTAITATPIAGSDAISNAYVHQFTESTAYIAFSIPYVPSKQRKKLLSDLHDSGGVAAAFTLATSEAGNAVASVNISAVHAHAVINDNGTAGTHANTNATASSKIKAAKEGGQQQQQQQKKKRTLIWFQVRQHAWESGSSWVADGLARYAASAAGISTLLSVADVVVTPIVDVDNVVVGGAGKDQEPVDFNRDWCPLGTGALSHQYFKRVDPNGVPPVLGSTASHQCPLGSVPYTE